MGCTRSRLRQLCLAHDQQVTTIFPIAHYKAQNLTEGYISPTTVASERPLLPQELFDLVIDEISFIWDNDEWTRGLVNLSLVSKAFRDRAHKHLFASVEINRDNPNTRRTVHQLCKLIQADPFSETSGLASRIISFTCFFWPKDPVPLAIIFRKLFRDRDEDMTHPTPCTLNLSLGTRWTALDKDLSLALFEVCHRPRLESLSILNFQHIPQNFLRNTFIKHLKLGNTSLSEPLPEHFFADVPGKGHDQAVILESLGVSVEFSVRSMLDISRIATQQVPPTVIFSKLKSLWFNLIPATQRTTQALEEILQGASSSLQILFVKATSGYVRPIPFRILPKLHTFIGICHSNRDFLSTCSILLGEKDLCPALENVKLCFYIPAVSNEEDLMDHLRRLQCSLFDGSFTRPHFDQIRFLTFEVYLLLSARIPYPGDSTPETFSSLIKSQFPCISAKKNLDFSVMVTTFPLRP